MAKTKRDIVDTVISNAKPEDVMSRRQIERLVDGVFEAIKSNVTDGESVAIMGFGTFNCVECEARSYRTPQGKTVSKPKHNKISFKVSKKLSAMVE